jgi:outer membrane receptor for ferrienterochelin and colicin
MRCLATNLLFASLLLAVLCASLPGIAQSTGRVSGVVLDETGAVVQNARVTISDETGATRGSAVTKSDGSFVVNGLSPGRYRVSAESTQFESGQSTVSITAASAMASVTLKLKVRPVTQEMTVTAATRSGSKVEDLPVSASVVTRDDIRDSPAQSLDQFLLQVPGVNLQEPPSFAQHPTANAVSMRGLGGERTLVLLDGVPLNDAFFGYVQWNRVSPDSIDQVEVVRGGASSLWGNYAMSGVINVVSKEPVSNDVSLFESYGSDNTYQLAGAADLVASRRVKLNLRADRFSTDGYNTTRKFERGPLDVATSFHQNNVQANVLFQASDSLTAYLRGNYHNNNQVLVTRAGTNDQHDAGVTTGLTKRFADSSYLELNSRFQHSRFVTFNTDVPSNGTVGFQEFVQNVHTTPANDFGLSAQWTKSLNEKIQLVQFGGDFRRIAGSDSAAIFNETGAHVRTDLGKGKQQFIGLFGQLALKPFAIPLEITLSARYDHFLNYDGFDGNPGGSGKQRDKDKNSFDPRLAVRYRVTDAVAVRGAVYRAFRAPTLDNLYRGFSTTSGTFLPNSQLGPETLLGGEVGSDVRLGRFLAGLTLFRNDVHNLIGFRNLTDAELPPGFFFGSKNINVGKVRSDGLELTAEYAFSRSLVANAAYTYTHSRALSSPEDPLSVGKQTATIPRNFAAAGLRWRPAPRWETALQTRWVGRSFGDSDNTLPQDRHFIADAHVDYQLTRMVQLFASASNLLNRTYVATNSGFEPAKLGPPFQAFFGVRLQLAKEKGGDVLTGGRK